jgi:hypothetical protein
MLSGRSRKELQGVVGLFAGVVRLRTDVSDGPTFRTALERVREASIEALNHQSVPFGRVRSALMGDDRRGLDPGRGATELPVDVQYFTARWDNWQPGSAALARHPRHGVEDPYFVRGQRHPLMFSFFDDGTEMWATISYKPAFYNDGTIDWLAAQLTTVLDLASLCPDRPFLELLQ